MSDQIKNQILNVVSYMLLALIGYLWVSSESRRTEEHRAFMDVIHEIRVDVTRNHEIAHQNAIDIARIKK